MSTVTFARRAITNGPALLGRVALLDHDLPLAPTDACWSSLRDQVRAVQLHGAVAAVAVLTMLDSMIDAKVSERPPSTDIWTSTWSSEFKRWYWYSSQNATVWHAPLGCGVDSDTDTASDISIPVVYVDAATGKCLLDGTLLKFDLKHVDFTNMSYIAGVSARPPPRGRVGASRACRA